MTLPMVTCPLCCRPGFSTSDSLCSALVDVTTRKLCCPICNYVVIGLDKFTIHLFSHSVNKCGIQQSKEETFQICNSESSYSNKCNVVLNTESTNNSAQISPNVLPCIVSNSDNGDGGKSVSIPESSVFYLKGENGQIFSMSSDSIGSSFKNVTINTQNYITNTNITTSSVKTSRVVERLQKRKYSQVFESEYPDNKSKSDTNGSDHYYNVDSVNSWPSTPSVSSETDKQCSGTPEKEFESCKDLLTKGDFSSEEVGDLEIKISSKFENDSGVGEKITEEPDHSKKIEDRKEYFGCDLCPIILPNKTILAMHKQLIHKKVEPEVEVKPKLLDCDACPRRFSLRSSLIIHQKVAHAGGFGNSEPGNCSKDCKHACNVCGKFFKKEIHLTQHLKAHDEKQWQCTICSKTFTTKYFLKKHRRLHTGETPYKCNKCDKAFTFQQSYHKHLLYHNDEKPYCCSHCGRTFKELSTLHNHERIHSGEKPFSCETCGKAFRQRVSYLVHRRIHTGAMPYKCTACDKSFRYKISQRTHKCPAQPPGVVVRTTGSLVERLQAAMSKNSEEPATSEPEKEVKTQKMEVEPGSSTSKDEEVIPSTNSVATDGVQSAPEFEKCSIKNSAPLCQIPEKVHVEKPQIYILFKGPNEETYYQPLIISQILPGTSNQSVNNVNPADNSLLIQSNNSSVPLITNYLPPAIKSSTSVEKENQNNHVTDTIPNQIIESKIEYTTLHEPSLFSNNFSSTASDDTSQLVILGDKQHAFDLKDTNYHSEFSQKKELKNTDNITEAHNRPTSSTVEEILNELNSVVDQHAPQRTALNTSDTICEHSKTSTAETHRDVISMDSSDMFSFLLSPNLTSPSDRLGKLTLSPNSNIDSTGSSKINTHESYLNPVSQAHENDQENILDNLSDEALKELLFGKFN